MADHLPSISDLMPSDEPGDKEGPQAKFAKKHGEIKLKQIEVLAHNHADSLGVPYVDLAYFPVGQEALALLPEKRAREISAACFYYDGKHTRLASTKPLDPAVQQALADIMKSEHCPQGQVYLVSQPSLNHLFDLYKTLPKYKEFSDNLNLDKATLDRYSDQFTTFTDLQKQIASNQVSEVVVVIFAAALKSGASDMHIEAEEDGIKVRFRLDGVLHDVATLDAELWRKIISRLKGMAHVKINITDRPQDGRLSVDTSEEQVDVRVSFLPTTYGESVVMRFLRASAVGLSFEDLGLRAHDLAQLQRQVDRPNGMIVVTGPTGSGKTTTLYAVLKRLNTAENKIITIEDPIEYQITGINQSQTNEHYTFAQALKSMVRQDPDIIMVGEIRDLETAEIAIQAALTGHLVLSTIHTNDAAGTVPRFLSMGVKPFLLAPSLNAMIGQRLVRRLCEHCKAEEKLTPSLQERVNKILNELPADEKKDLDLANLKFYQSKGCDACQGIGFKGRIGIYEVMLMSDEVEKVILSGAVSEYDMRKLSAAAGMTSMVQDGLLKAAQGITSVDEVFRVAE